MPITNVTLGVTCGGTWNWGGATEFDVALANGETFGVRIQSLKLTVDGIPGAVKEITDVYPVMQPSGGQDVDLVVPLPFNPPNPPTGQSYDIVCATEAVVARMDGSDATTLTETCMCTVQHRT